MALLYSRPRLKFPNFYIYKNRNEGAKIKRLVLIIFLIIFLNAIIIKAIHPVFNKLCEDKAKGIATVICNKQTSETIRNYNYSDFVIVHMDKGQNIKMLEANMVNINTVISDITEKIQNEINNKKGEEIYISSGNLTGITLLSGRGPNIPIRIIPIGNIKTEFKSEFIEKGVNQTLHRLYLEIYCEISILTPFNTIDETINNQFIIAENIIVGNIPTTYYNLEGMEKDEATQIMK